MPPFRFPSPPATPVSRARQQPWSRSLLVSSLLAALPGLAGATCATGGTAVLTRAHCDTDYIQYYADGGSVVLDISEVTLSNGGIELAPSRPDSNIELTGGPYDQTLNLTGNVLINNPSYSGVIMQSYKTGRKVTVNAEAGVNITSGGGFGGIWVRNDTSGDIRISSAATVRSTNDDGITGATNGGNVSVSNSGQVTSEQTRGLYADGGYSNLETDPVLVSILNDTGGSVSANLAGARSINYQGMSQIENRAWVQSSTRQGLVAWSNNGPAKIINSGTVSSGDDHGIQVATEKGDATVLNSGSVTAHDDPNITVARSGYAAIYAEVDLDTSVATGTPGAHGDVYLTNTGTGNVQAPADYALYMATPEGNITLINQGTAHGLHGAWVNAVNGTVDLSNSGSLSGTDPAGIGLRVVAANAGTVVNSGSLGGTTTSIKTDAAATLSSVRNLASGSLDGHLQLAGAGPVYNAGVLSLPAAGTSTVAGSYTQADNGSAGRLRLVVTGPSGYGRLSVTGAVSLPDNSGIEVLTRDAAGCAAIPVGTTLSSVLSSSTSLSLGNVWVSDDCDHMNFRAVRNGLVVNLVSELPVQAACGDAVNHASTFVPTQNLCLRGTASAVSSGSPWSWSCQGTPGGSDAVCTAPNASTAGSGNLNGLGRADLSSPPGNSNAWVVDPSSRGFISTSDPAAPARLPVGVSFPFGLLDVKLVTGDAGSQAQLRITYPNPLPAGSAWWKYGPTQANPTPHWYVYGGAVLSGNTVTLTLQDGGAGDDDLRVNSEIVDPGGVGLADPAAMPTNVPTLSEWGLALLASLMAGLGLAGKRRRLPRA